MAFVRAGKDSDVYLLGAETVGVQVIQCCGCKFTPVGKIPPEEEAKMNLPDWAGTNLDWPLEADPEFSSAAAALEHLDRHRDAGHMVPARAYEAVKKTDWVGP